MEAEHTCEELQVFDAGSATLRELLRGYSHRPQQGQMATAVARSLEETVGGGPARALLVEAGTGVGKTLAYLVPLLAFALRENKRVLVSTETKSLQQQILGKDIPIVEKILGRRIHSELCLGASNYVCKRKLARVVSEGSFDPDTADQVDALLDWEGSTRSGLRQEFRGPLPPALWRKITRDPEDCLGSRCPNYEVSYYFLAREQWRQARLLVVNHSLLASHFVLEGRFLPEFSHLVVDEAHRFPEIYHNAYINQATFDEMQTLSQEVGRRGVDVTSLFERFRNRLAAAIQLPRGGHARRQTGLGFDEGRELMKGMEQAASVLKLRLDDLKAQQELGLDAEPGATGQPGRLEQSIDFIEMQSMLQRLNRQRVLVDAATNGAGRDEVFWISRDSGAEQETGAPNYRLHRAPLYPGPLFQETFFPRGLRSTIFTSATLTTGPAQADDAFTYFAGELGLHGNRTGGSGALNPEDPAPTYSTLHLDSPFDFAARAILYLPPGMPDPTKEEEHFHQAAAREIERLLLLTRGGAFVLFTSARSLRAVAAILSQARGRYSSESSGEDQSPPFELISQLDQGAPAALQRFRESERGVLLGLATFWQGIDVPGDSLRLVILVRLPFRVPDEPLLAARMERERALGRDSFKGLQLPAATLSIKQGFGRLIRTDRDRGMVAILDPRVQTRGYGRQILAALPPARRIRSFPEVVQAYREMFRAER